MLLTLDLLITFLLILLYYKFIKQGIIYIAPTLAKQCKLTKKYPIAKAVGVVELPCIAFTHLLFCIALSFILKINLFEIGLFHLPFSYLIWGALLGIGMMSFSTLLCQASISFIQLVAPRQSPQHIDTWLTIARGGWVRHHLHSLEICPLWLTITIVFIQIASEEIVFRGIILNHFLIYGECLSILTSTLFFVLMQTFFMPSLLSAMFPMMGALVMGLVHGFLYLHIPLLFPLIIAHLVFFCFATL